jgi:division protein CdvB (Snf7/Vps24/ESCRT-III family)
MQSGPLSALEQLLQHVPGSMRGLIYFLVTAVVVALALAWVLVPFAVMAATARLKRMKSGIDAMGTTLDAIAAKLDSTNKALQEMRAMEATLVQDPLPMAAKGRLDRIATLIDAVAAKLDLTNRELLESRKLQAVQAQESLQFGAKGRLDRMVSRLDAIGSTLIALNKELQDAGALQATQPLEPLRTEVGNKVTPPR